LSDGEDDEDGEENAGGETVVVDVLTALGVEAEDALTADFTVPESAWGDGSASERLGRVAARETLNRQARLR